MKKIVVLVFLIVSVSTFAQPVKVSESNRLMAQEVIEFSGKSADEIYKAAKMWINSTYKNPDNVLTGDIENISIKGNGFRENFAVYKSIISIFWDVSYHFAIDIKDERIRITLNDFETSSDSGNYSAEYYCVNKAGEFRKSTQSQLILNGLNELATDHIESLRKMFTEQASSDW